MVPPRTGRNRDARRRLCGSDPGELDRGGGTAVGRATVDGSRSRAPSTWRDRRRRRRRHQRHRPRYAAQAILGMSTWVYKWFRPGRDNAETPADDCVALILGNHAATARHRPQRRSRTSARARKAG
ncbi:MAG: hypothetical protein AB1679_00465 [Actinomycetota bacterium]